MNIYRQGDVLLIKVDSLPSGAVAEENEDRIVLAHGEVTGHAHAVDAQLATMYAFEGNRLLTVRETTALVHEEHSPIKLEPGIYKVVRQREYTPSSFRYVHD